MKCPLPIPRWLLLLLLQWCKNQPVAQVLLVVPPSKVAATWPPSHRDNGVLPCLAGMADVPVGKMWLHSRLVFQGAQGRDWLKAGQFLASC